MGSFCRGEEQAIGGMRATIEKIIKNMEELIATVDSEKNVNLKPLMSLEYDLCKRRLDFLKLVLSDKPDDLKALECYRAGQTSASSTGS